MRFNISQIKASDISREKIEDEDDDDDLNSREEIDQNMEEY